MLLALGCLLALLAALAACEMAGWPFLQAPLERRLSQALHRTVHLGPVAGSLESRGMRVRLFGSVRLSTPELVIEDLPQADGAGAGSEPMLRATDVQVRLRWRDLLAMRSKEHPRLRVARLQADTLAARLHRSAQGQANWDFGDPAERGQDKAPTRVQVDTVLVRDGRWSLRDVPLKTQLDGTVALVDPGANSGVTDRAGVQSSTPADSPASGAARVARAASSAASQVPEVAAADAPASAPHVVATARGSYRGLPANARLQTGSVQILLDAVAASAARGDETGLPAPRVPVRFDATVGRAKIRFDGHLDDPLGDGRVLGGRYDVQGPSLAAVGEPLGVTLPTTSAFAMRGTLHQQGPVWSTVVDRLTIGRSLLRAALQFSMPEGAALPVLAGHVRGPALWLADLGPAIGLDSSSAGKKAERPRSTRVLPDREFDLPALNRMNANVAFDIDRFESGSEALKAVSPLRAHLLLQGGVLTLKDIDARLAQGRITGRIALDGRGKLAKWQTQLRTSGLVVQDWIRVLQRDGQRPYVTGRLASRIDLRGTGRSTAQLLASADGRIGLQLRSGSISHLAVEAAGIDIAQALGILIKGDDNLPVQCAIGELTVKDGVARPKPFIIDTHDSTIWLDGSIALTDERLDLTARVAPKDFTIAAVRSPLRVTGTLGAPKVGVEGGPIARRLVPAALLALINPLAAILPLIDDGDEDAKAAAQACRAASARWGGKAGG